MCPFNRFLFVRLLLLCLLVLTAASLASAAPGQVMISYSDIPIYGRDSAINATIDLYLPDIALDETQHELGIVLQDDLPIVLFLPSLTGPIMREYAQDLTARGYGVIAVDYRLQAAVQDSVCALAWAHTVGERFHLDANHIAAVGYLHGGRIAALLGSMGQPPASVSEGCPYPMPEPPMIEAVATYDAELGTPVALLDTAFQLTSLPPVGTTRAQMVALFNEFAAVPADEWRTLLPDVVVASKPVVDLWGLVPPEIAAAYSGSQPGADVARPEAVIAVGMELWALAPPEVAAMFAAPAPETVDIPLVAVNQVVEVPVGNLGVELSDDGLDLATNLNSEWMSTIAYSLPTFWLDGNEPPHLLMVGSESNAVIHADNAVYTELLRDEGVPVQLTEMIGCGHDPCALIGEMEPLNLFLAEVLYSS